MSDAEQKILEQLDIWFAALTERDASKVAGLYSENAVLVPTLWNGPCFGRKTIRNYFEVAFLPLEPQGYLVNYVASHDGDIATLSGHYIFRVKDCTHKAGADDGDCDPAYTTKPARFTFVYKRDKKADKWEIIAHHSSKMPEEHSTKAIQWISSERFV